MRRWLALVAIAACHRPEAQRTPDAAPPPPSVTPIIVPHDGGLSPEKLAEMLAGPDASACPRPIHPDYCRRGCRNFASRASSMHARRMSPSRRAGKGKCGKYLVFAEEQRSGDGGVGGTLVEYFDPATNAIVGAQDSRRTPCGNFGEIPKCTLEIEWGPVK